MEPPVHTEVFLSEPRPLQGCLRGRGGSASGSARGSHPAWCSHMIQQHVGSHLLLEARLWCSGSGRQRECVEAGLVAAYQGGLEEHLRPFPGSALLADGDELAIWESVGPRQADPPGTGRSSSSGLRVE